MPEEVASRSAEMRALIRLLAARYTGTQTLPFGPKMRAMPAAAQWEV